MYILIHILEYLINKSHVRFLLIQYTHFVRSLSLRILGSDVERHCNRAVPFLGTLAACSWPLVLQKNFINGKQTHTEVFLIVLSYLLFGF